MKLSLLLLLALLLKLPAGDPPKVRVTLSPLTKTAYEQARKTAIVTKPTLTFPLKKQKGRIVIPTDNGARVFKDNPVAEEDPDWELYKYLGYSSQLDCHLIEHSHYEWLGYILIDKGGRQTEIFSNPFYSPDLRGFATISAGIEDAVFPNEIRIYRFKNHHWRQVWKLEPSVDPATWEPSEIYWLSNSTLLLKKRMWTGKNPGTTFAYAKLEIH